MAPRHMPTRAMPQNIYATRSAAMPASDDILDEASAPLIGLESGLSDDDETEEELEDVDEESEEWGTQERPEEDEEDGEEEADEGSDIVEDAEMSEAGYSELGELSPTPKWRRRRPITRALKAKSEESIKKPHMEKPDHLLDSAKVPSTRKETYGSNENVYNPYKPYSSKEFIAQEVAAGRIKGLNDHSGIQGSPRKMPSSVGSGMKNMGISTPDRDVKSSHNPFPSRGATIREDLLRAEKYCQHGPHAEQGALADPPGLRSFMPRSPPSSHSESASRRSILGFDSPYQQRETSASISPTLTRASLANGLPARLSQPIAPFYDYHHSEMGQQPMPPLLARSSQRMAKASSSAGADLGEGDTDVYSQNKPGMRSRRITVRPKSRKRKSAVPHAARAAGLQTTQSSPLSQGSVSRRQYRKRRRSDVSPHDAVPRPDSTGGIQAQQAGYPPESANMSRLAGISGLEGSGRPSPSQTSAERPNIGVPDSARVPQLRAEAPLSMIQTSSWSLDVLEDHGWNRSEYMECLAQLPEALRLRVYEQLGDHGIRPPTKMFSSKGTLLLAPRYYCTRHLVFTSELLPRNFDAQKRLDLLCIFRTKAPYIPACISTIPNLPKIQYHTATSQKASSIPPPKKSPRSKSHNVALDTLAPELFHMIAEHCSYETLKKLRLVNRKFEKYVSNCVFSTAVVPFNLGIYGMMVQANTAKVDFASKEMDDGMKVFKAWGRYVKKFAMAFEVDEEQLCNPPKKDRYEQRMAFWGSYKWPHRNYSRYEHIEGLEKKADEFRCMSSAISNFSGVRDLGLSLDSGLGWISGPDISDRAQIFQGKPTIFGPSHPEHDIVARGEWEKLMSGFDLKDHEYRIEGGLIYNAKGPILPNHYGYYEGVMHLDRGNDNDRPSLLFRNSSGQVDRSIAPNEALVYQGIDLFGAAHMQPGQQNHIRNTEQATKDSPFKSAALIPNSLTSAQKEWLLETEWAQRAFMSSYCMALADNAQTFKEVRSLVIAKLSSRYLPALQREDFWKALPNLSDLTIKVSADFRDIQKTNAGIVEAPDIAPSQAAIHFHNLVRSHIATLSGIKTLNLGYYGGGERQEGIFGRNQNVLPAPLNDFTNHRNFLRAKLLSFPHVENMTLTNCWIAPTILKRFVAQMAAFKLHTLTLDSVSLTAHLGNSHEPNPLENGVYAVANGLPRRFGDAELGNLWQNRGNAPDPSLRLVPKSWLVNGARINSWRNVIDAITPGPTVDFLRYAYQHMDEPPKLRNGPLERINFRSCGYVRLPEQEGLEQDVIGKPTIRPPDPCLEKRAMDLMPVMMHRNWDMLLGQIVPTLNEEELDVFHTCFPMTIGWGDDMTKYHNREDGQPDGGSGRFSGHVEKLKFS